MKIFSNLLLAILLQFPSFAFGIEGPCDSVGRKVTWGRAMQACIMMETVINDTGFLITSPKDDSVRAFTLYNNKKVEYLPENTAEKFANLEILLAPGCSIKSVSKLNFKNLKNLEILDLSDNEIQKIESETFSDLVALELLWLSSNKIKSLNGQAFSTLGKLRSVYLNTNVCINEDFLTMDRIAEMPQVVSAKCGLTTPSFVVSTTQGLDHSTSGHSTSTERTNSISYYFKQILKDI